MTPTEPVRDIHVRVLIGWSPEAPPESISLGLGLIGWVLIFGFFALRTLG